jgi:hypothetical protein
MEQMALVVVGNIAGLRDMGAQRGIHKGDLHEPDGRIAKGMLTAFKLSGISDDEADELINDFVEKTLRGIEKRKRGEKGRKPCYLHDDTIEPNETPFNEGKHHICIFCLAKLHQLAEAGLMFDFRKKTVAVRFLDEKYED